MSEAIIVNPIDRDNEALIIANAIKSEENRNKFVRKVSYGKFRTKEFQALAWGIIEAAKDNLEVNIDAVLLKSKSCPVRYLVEFDFIQQLVNNFPEVPTVNFEGHLEKLILDNTKQKMIDWVTNSVLPCCTNPTTKLSDIEQRITYGKQVLETGYSATKLSFKTMEEVIVLYDEMKTSGTSKRTTGFTQLDEFLTEGLKDGQVTTVAGLSSMGKSSLALTIMKNLSHMENPVHTAQFALEMNNMSIASKFLSFKTQLPLNTIVKKPSEMSDADLQMYLYEKEQLTKNKFIFLDDNPIRSLAGIREQIMLLQDKIQQQYIVVVIDLFGKIKDLQGSDNFARDYEQKLNIIQAMTRELGVHMILVAQINKAVSQRKEKRPTMNDLKNAGALTEVSDVVIGIHRPYYDPQLKINAQLAYGMPTITDTEFGDDAGYQQIERDPNENVAEIIILKQRMGPKDVMVNFIFDPNTTCFYPITEEYQQRLNIAKVDSDLM